MGSSKYLPRQVVAHAAFVGDGDREEGGLEDELAPDRFLVTQPDELFLSEQGRVENYGLRMMLRGL
ncbi:MAG: hypothetical protein REI09_09905 [Candidatus Dactylopiibacterium sp.]|nr:hypothetical protein [Candidatus Dactylopiibacterium sp.]